MTQNQKVLLELVSASLHGRPANVPGKLEWQEVLEESKRQSVLLQAYYSAEPFLPTELKNDYKPLCDRIVANNIRIEWEHAELHSAMMSADIPYVVIKGCASSSYYPDPTLRILGDVDFLVSTDAIGKAGETLEEIGFKRSDVNDEKIHYVYTRAASGGQSVWEMHWRVNGVPDGDFGIKLMKCLSTALVNSQEHTTPSGVMKVPSAFHHGLILLLHTAIHLMDTGVGLRHLCDWAVFVEYLDNDEFCEIFEKKLKHVGLWKFAQLLTRTSARAFGYDVKPWTDGIDDELANSVLEDIFDGGNFGCNNIRRLHQTLLIMDKSKSNIAESSMIKNLFSEMNKIVKYRLTVCKKHPILLPLGWIYICGRYGIRILLGKRPSINIGETVLFASKRRDLYNEFLLFENSDKE